MGADATIANKDNWLPLHVASAKGHTSCVKLLLAAAPSTVTALTNLGWTALHWAAANHHAAVAHELIAAGANVDEPTVKEKISALDIALFHERGASQPVSQKRAAKAKRYAEVRLARLEKRRMERLAALKKYRPIRGVRHSVRKRLIKRHQRVLKALRKKAAAEKAAIATIQTASPAAVAVEEPLPADGEDVVLELLNANCKVNTPEGQLVLTPLHVAARHGYVRAVKTLLARGAHVNARDTGSFTPLLTALLHGREAVAAVLLEAGADVKIRTLHESTPLQFAARSCSPATIQALLSAGCSVNELDSRGWSALHLAARFNNVAAAAALIDAGADVNIVNRLAWTPLHTACLRGHIAVVKLLLERGAKPALLSKHGARPVFLALREGFMECALQLAFLDDKALLPSAQRKGASFIALRKAVAFGSHEMVRLLVQRGHQLNDGVCSPLLSSVTKHMDASMVKLLLELGADVDRPHERTRMTALHQAVIRDQVDIVKILLEAGANVNALNKHGLSPVHIAILKKRADALKLFLETNADALREPTAVGCTPLMLAARLGNTELVKFLLTRGVSARPTDKRGYNALHHAARRNQPEVIRLLLQEHDGAPNMQTANKKRETALHIAAAHGHVEAVNVLMESKGDPRITDSRNATPLELALVCGKPEPIRAILNHPDSTMPLRNIRYRMDMLNDATRAAGRISGSVVKSQGNRRSTQRRGRGRGRGRGGFRGRGRGGYRGGLGRGGRMRKNPIETVRSAPALLLAARHGLHEIVELILQRGADVNAATSSGFTSLHDAAGFGRLEVAKVLLRHNADVNLLTKYGWTPLMLAARRSHNEVLRLLLEHNANLTPVSRHGNNALLEAIRHDNAEGVRLLMEAGADPKTRGRTGTATVIYPLVRKRPEIAVMLASRGGLGDIDDVKAVMAEKPSRHASPNVGAVMNFFASHPIEGVTVVRQAGVKSLIELAVVAVARSAALIGEDMHILPLELREKVFAYAAKELRMNKAEMIGFVDKDSTDITMRDAHHLHGENLAAVGQICGPTLRNADLSWCWTGDDVHLCEFIANTPNLRTLNLTGCWGLTATVVRKLSTSCALLESLDLTACETLRIDESVLNCLANLRHLKSLSLAGQFMRPKTTSVKAREGYAKRFPLQAMPQLESLTLSPHLFAFTPYKPWLSADRLPHMWAKITSLSMSMPRGTDLVIFIALGFFVVFPQRLMGCFFRSACTIICSTFCSRCVAAVPADTFPYCAQPQLDRSCRCCRTEGAAAADSVGSVP
eukprot:TRINITY_DN8147_c0_g1_i2.p1 TRINITY_DN8147_c0_g1~~TRINITY_DN8147_c0_g1_i2.p1  ORF type:complete len:1447 (-),score=339.37 TRINITY_DN8147_c0_g1_i2:189-3998(-)